MLLPLRRTLRRRRRRYAEVRVAQRVHEVGGRLAADERRAEGGRVVYVIVDGLLAAL
jgi:hypothetical protein